MVGQGSRSECDPGVLTRCNALRVLHPTKAVAVAFEVRAATVAVAVAVAVAVRVPVCVPPWRRCPEREKVRRLFERSAA